MMLDFLKSFRAPYTALTVSLATMVAIFLLVYDGLGVERSSFIFAAILTAGFGSKALIALMVGAIRTGTLMIVAMMLLIIMTLLFTDAAVFMDAAVEGMVSGAAGALVVYIGALLERHKE